MPEIRQSVPAGFIQSENCAANTPAKSPFGTLRMPSGALFSSSTWPASSSRAPRSELVPQSTAIRCGTLLRQSRQHHSIMRCMKPSQAVICEARMNSLGWCAWAMSPGPHTTVGTPSVLRKMPASVP